MYLLPPSGEKWIYYTFLFFIYFFKDGLRNLYSLFYLKGIYITAINCILTYIIKIRKGVTFKQLVAQMSHAHLSAHQQEKKDSTFFVEYFWVVLHKHKCTGPHSGGLSLLCTLLMCRPRDSIHLKVLPQ